MTVVTDLELCRYINENYPEADITAFTAFSQQMFNNALSVDLHRLSTLQRYQIALSLWQSFSSANRQKNTVVIENSSQEAGLVEGSVIHIITDDKAFIVDSISALLMEQDYKINVFLHPVMNREQLLNGCESKKDSHPEQSILYIALANQLTAKVIEQLLETIQNLLADIDRVTQDWPLMMAKTEGIKHQTSTANGNEAKSFLSWLCQEHFVFLGYNSLKIKNKGNAIPIDDCLGMFNEDVNVANEVLTLNSAEFNQFIISDNALKVSKSLVKSTIHRHDYLDLVSVKAFSAQGNLIAVHQFVGLFTQVATNLHPNKNPFLKDKLAKIIRQLSLKLDSHDYRNFIHILAALPKRELYESSNEQLLDLAKNIHNLNVRSKSGVFIRENDFNEQVSILVFVSKDAFCTDLRDEIETELSQVYQGEILSRRSMLNDNYLAQWHFIVKKDDSLKNEVDISALIASIEAKTQSWNENLTSLISQVWQGQQASILVKKYKNAFSKSYREHFSAQQAISAINNIECLTTDNDYQFQIVRSPQSKTQLTLNIFTLAQTIALSDSIPILEQFGFRPVDEFSFKVSCSNNGTRSKAYSYTLECPGEYIDIEAVKVDLEQALAQVWAGHIESDGYNKLLLGAQLNIRQIIIIRAYGKYLRQLGLGYSEEYFQQALINYPDIVHSLINLFETRFALSNKSIKERTVEAEVIKTELLQSLSTVTKIDHDRILRNFIAAISATLRTNFYQTSPTGEPKSYCAFKIRSGEIDDAPQPRPYVETFVYSPQVEGVHLRFGPVSRGGLRWSDRQEDFRTEVLGLVKAQQVKNVVIVPQGAKGGFVPKQLPVNGSREQITLEAISCYKVFISALLDITDNNTASGIVKPKDVVCFDGDDSYLVVAADKGTATFSDIANEIAQDYGFWLGDAFASGGSVGYDHKKMGITAKGAWVSVQRHFSEMDIDVQQDEISVIGIGDMSGDVFGNGMLSSKTIKLVAAFDHRDIFIDPNPDSTLSYVERSRLYQLDRSSWQDYDKTLISAGGGVFSRTVKHIELSTPIKQLLNIDSSVKRLSPNDLIRHILLCQADLLWFGGIGTYVKSSDEINTEVGDKANDLLRVNGNELQCKVIGEGGNLGCSQLARIEFAKAGGKINTDAVDNSAGVNCSDAEVNIKILLNGIVAKEIITKLQRDTLLASMTDEVGLMVLRNNYYQAQALSIDEANSQSHFDSFTRLSQYLVNSAGLNRELEFLPDDEELQARSVAQQGLTRPELAVLMAYSKMDVHDALLKEKLLITDKYFEKHLLSAFPAILAKDYNQAIIDHPLAKQIIATSVANEIFNRGGIHALREQTGATIAEIVKAFIIAKEVFALDDIWRDIEALQGRVSALIQIKMMIEVQRFYRLMAIWFINHANANESIATIVQRYKPGLSSLKQLNSDDISLPFTPVDESLYQLEDEPLAQALVDKIHQLKVSSVVFCDIVKTASELNLPVTEILPCYSQMSQLLGLPWLIEQTEKVSATDHWSRLARFSLLLDLLEIREKLVVNVINGNRDVTASTAVDLWSADKVAELKRLNSILDDLKSTGSVVIDKLYFANRQLRTLMA
ncbi:NAD-glutamate dehydrogenase [Colwellia piezophila]|uniref:NAD-glutamate dehydrogenase n=1 Tax=Colwellia piezophila TaxID=211668 RepID=UPI0003769ADF|nr:NAD-glutamate dehydrogenase [Colwellia piezophila]